MTRAPDAPPPKLSDLIREHFPGAERSPNGWRAPCPVCGAGSFAIEIVSGESAFRCPEKGCTAAAVGKALGLTEDDLLNAAVNDVAPTAPLPVVVPDAARDDGKSGKSGKSGESLALVVADYIYERYDLGRSTDGLLFALPKSLDAPRAACELNEIRPRLAHGMYHTWRKAVTRNTIDDALLIAQGEALGAAPVPLALRSTLSLGRIHLDLSDEHGRSAVASADGWHVEPLTTDPLFRRSMKPLPVPIRGGSVNELRGLLRLDASDSRWLLAYGWLVASLFADRPRPLLWATGPQGSGKSTRALMLASVVDPRDALGAAPGREHDDFVAAVARYLVSYDNISKVTPAMSDFLCRLVTRISDERRKLYSDGTLITHTIFRTGVCTSITMPAGVRDDALGRLVILPFDQIPDTARTGEAEMWAAFTDGHPRILGSLLDDVSGVLKHLDDVIAERPAVPRMADYAHILLSLDRAHGLTDDGHFAAYRRALGGALAERAEDDPFASAILLAVRRQGGRWEGTAEQLLRLVHAAAATPAGLLEHPWLERQWLPASARSLGRALLEASESLRHAGVRVEKRASNGRRLISLEGLPGFDLAESDQDAAGTPGERLQAPAAA